MSEKQAIHQEVKDVRRHYTRTPNILFESYGDLHPQEKWLFINLVYLCGAPGTRYLSIRYISDRTGISAGALSGSKDPEKNNPGMIRRLDAAGLIHAEIKRRKRRDGSEAGQEQYHITITDIWQLNELYFTEKRSENEQFEDESVQNVNGSVRKMNTNGSERSENERERSDSDTNIRLHSNTTDSNKITEQEERHALSSESDERALKEEIRQKFESDPHLRAITQQMIAASQGIHEEDDPDKTETRIPTAPKLPVVAKGQSNAPTSTHSPANTGMDTHGSGSDRLPEQTIATGVIGTASTPVQHSEILPTGISASLGAAQAGTRTTIPKRPRRGQKPVTIELTLQGAQVKAWYDEIRGTKLRITEKNVAACNALGENEDVTHDSLKATIEHLDGLKWVQDHDFSIDIQVLASDESRLNFEKNWPLVKRKLAMKNKPTHETDNYGSVACLMAHSTPVAM